MYVHLKIPHTKTANDSFIGEADEALLMFVLKQLSRAIASMLAQDDGKMSSM